MPNTKELLIYPIINMLIIGTTIILDVNTFKDVGFVIFGSGLVVHLAIVGIIILKKYAYFGLCAAFLSYSGLFLCTTTFIALLTNDEPFVYTILEFGYAFCGVFGGIRTYRAWLKHRPVKERKL
jgi:hypothetical protein